MGCFFDSGSSAPSCQTPASLTRSTRLVFLLPTVKIPLEPIIEEFLSIWNYLKRLQLFDDKELNPARILEIHESPVDLLHDIIKMCRSLSGKA